MVGFSAFDEGLAELEHGWNAAPTFPKNMDEVLQSFQVAEYNIMYFIFVLEDFHYRFLIMLMCKSFFFHFAHLIQGKLQRKLKTLQLFWNHSGTYIYIQHCTTEHEHFRVSVLQGSIWIKNKWEIEPNNINFTVACI